MTRIRRLRQYNQLLHDKSRSNSAAAVVSRLCALQSQEWSSAQLAIAARTSAVTQADVRRAREIDRSFILTWSLRGTLHLVAAEDIATQLALCGPRAVRGTNRRYQQLGLTEHVRDRSLDEISDILEKAGALTRAELAKQLARRDIPVEGQAIHHLVRHAALRGLICLGPERDGALTFVLLEQWLPAFESAEPCADLLPGLARRFLAAYGPASPVDLCRWAGLSAKAAKTAFDGIADDSIEVEPPDGKALMLAEQNEATGDSELEIGARFLPRYDNYMLAYQRRDFMVKPAYAKRVHPGGGLIRACVIIDGKAVANWKLEKRRAGMRVAVDPFERLDAGQVSLLHAEVESLGAFLDADIELCLDSD